MLTGYTSAHYQSLNPNGSVPTLIIDDKPVFGWVTIVRHLLELYDHANSLMNSSNAEHVLSWLNRIDDNQIVLKTLTYEFIYKPAGRFSDPKDVQHYIKHQQNTELADFVLRFHQGFPEVYISEQINLATELISDINEQLKITDYLAGDVFSLADIAAFVSIQRYKQCAFTRSQFCYVEEWFQRISERPVYQSAIADFEQLTNSRTQRAVANA